MAYVKGDWIQFYSGGVKLSLEMDVTISGSLDTIETTDKDSAGWKTFEDGDKSWTCSGTANVDFTATENVSQSFADFIAGAEVAIDVGSSTDTKYYSGNGLITTWTLNGPRNGLATFTFDVQGTGALAEGTTT